MEKIRAPTDTDAWAPPPCRLPDWRYTVRRSHLPMPQFRIPPAPGPDSSPPPGRRMLSPRPQKHHLTSRRGTSRSEPDGSGNTALRRYDRVLLPSQNSSRPPTAWWWSFATPPLEKFPRRREHLPRPPNDPFHSFCPLVVKKKRDGRSDLGHGDTPPRRDGGDVFASTEYARFPCPWDGRARSPPRRWSRGRARWSRVRVKKRRVASILDVAASRIDTGGEMDCRRIADRYWMERPYFLNTMRTRRG